MSITEGAMRHGVKPPAGDSKPTKCRPAGVPKEEIRFLGNLNRLELKPGDRFVLSTDERISMETHDRIQRIWGCFVGNPESYPLLILESGMKLGVIATPEE